MEIVSLTFVVQSSSISVCPHFQEGVLADLVDRLAIFPVLDKQFLYETTGKRVTYLHGRHLIRHDVSQIFLSFNVEGQFAGQQLVGQHSNSPNIGPFIVDTFGENFRRQIEGSAAEGSPEILVRVVYTPAKIRQFQQVIVVKKNVLWFDVSVDDGVGVQVFDSLTELPHQMSDLPHGEPRFLPALHQAVKSLLACKFLHQINIVCVAEDSIELNDVGVVQKRLNFDLLGQSVLQLLFLQIFLIHNLQCEHASGGLFLDQLYHAKRSLSQSLFHLKVFHPSNLPPFLERQSTHQPTNLIFQFFELLATLLLLLFLSVFLLRQSFSQQTLPLSASWRELEGNARCRSLLVLLLRFGAEVNGSA